MATTPITPEFARYKLETDFQDDHIVHTTYTTDPTARQRRARIAVKTKWVEKKTLGSGGHGIVSLQEDEEGNLRAVKRLPLGMHKIDYSQELKALSELSDVNIHMYLEPSRIHVVLN